MARADWPVKLRISVTSEEIIQINFVCGVYYLTVLVYTKNTIHISVGG